MSQLNIFVNHLLVGFQTTALYLLLSYDLFFWLSNVFTVPRKNRFLILSDSLSSLQATYNPKYHNAIIVQLLKLLMELT